jgi:hypothetical protein
MAPTKKSVLKRRTRAELDKLPVETLTVELVAAGIRPIEFVTVDDEAYSNHTHPHLEPHQRYDFGEYMHRASDPFVLEFYTRFPPPDLRQMWREQLYEHALKTYVESLSRSQLTKHLKEVTVDTYFDKVPDDKWITSDYREELRARITKLESTVQTPKRKRAT